MSDPFRIRPGVSLAPDWSRTEEDWRVSPFTDLPVLELCAHCRTALRPLTSWACIDGLGKEHRPLCQDCKDRVAAHRRLFEIFRGPEPRTTCGAGQDGECWAPGCPQNDPATRVSFCPLPPTGILALREADSGRPQ